MRAGSRAVASSPSVGALRAEASAMSNLSLSASVIALVLGASACLDNTQGAPAQTVGGLHDGKITGSFSDTEVKRNLAGELPNVTLTARDVGGDDTVVNSETYTDLQHGFSLSLPGGRYKIEFKDPAGHILETFPDVVVDGDMKLAPQGEAE